MKDALPASQRAIRMVDRTPVIEPNRCTGCGLCAIHCEGEPVALLARSLDEKSE